MQLKKQTNLADVGDNRGQGAHGLQTRLHVEPQLLQIQRLLQGRGGGSEMEVRSKKRRSRQGASCTAAHNLVELRLKLRQQNVVLLETNQALEGGRHGTTCDMYTLTLSSERMAAASAWFTVPVV